jgi:hypothetical protein
MMEDKEIFIDSGDQNVEQLVNKKDNCWVDNLAEIIRATTPIIFLSGALIVFSVAAVTKNLGSDIPLTVISTCLGASTTAAMQRKG